MDIDKALRVPFEDREWAVKAALGGVFTLVPFLGFALFGYLLDYVRAVANGRETPLPEWSDFGRYWVRGLLAGFAIFVYELPALVLFGVGFGPLVLAAVSGGDSRAAVAGGIGFACLFGALGLAWFVAVSVLAYAAAVNYAIHEDFGALFAFGEIWRRVRSGSGYFGAWGLSILIGIVLGIALGIVGSVLNVIPVIGSLAYLYASGFAGFLAYAMMGHLFGQYAARAYGLSGPGGAMPTTPGGPVAPGGPMAPPPPPPSRGGTTPPPPPPQA